MSIGQRECLALIRLAQSSPTTMQSSEWQAVVDIVQLEVRLGFVERLSGKIGVLQGCADGLRGTEYLRLNIFTPMLPET